MKFIPKHRTKSNEGITYASQEYAEQLRSIHFALLTISVALLLFIVSAKKYDSRAAIVQLEELVQLKKQWSPQLLLKDAEIARSDQKTSKTPVRLAYNSEGASFKTIPVLVSDRNEVCRLLTKATEKSARRTELARERVTPWGLNRKTRARSRGI